MLKKLFYCFCLVYISAQCVAKPIKIVAAENFYGALAKAIGGNLVDVTSIINNPNTDPHLFASSPATLKTLAKANIIIYNGLGYDAWLDNYLKADKTNNKVKLINVAKLISNPLKNNPHIWYKPDTFLVLAQKLSQILIKAKPNDYKEIITNLARFKHYNQQINDKIKAMRSKYQGIKVTATEPVYGYSAIALGLDMQGQALQQKIMNDSEPTPKMMAEYQDLISNGVVKLIFYNDQVTSGITKNIQTLAKKHNIALVPISETMPPNLTINQWLMQNLLLTESALQATNKPIK